MKKDLTQHILNLDGEPMQAVVSPEAGRIIQNLINGFSEKFGQKATDKIIAGLEEKKALPERMVLRDIVLNSLMIADKDDSQSEKLKTFKLLQRISSEDGPDLDETTCEDIIKKVSKNYNNVIVIGRTEELLMDGFEKKSKKKSKEDE